MKFLVVNDHPQPNNDRVLQITEKVQSSMQAIGFSQEDNEEDEAKIRARVGQYLSGPYAVATGENLDSAEDAISELLKSSMPEVGCIVWLYPLADKPDQVGYWVITRDATTSHIDDKVLSYLMKKAR